MTFLVLFMIGWFSLVLQSATANPQWMFGGQFLPLLMVLLYASIFTHCANAWLLALVFGVLWDALIGFRMGITSACLLAKVGLVLTQPLEKIRKSPLLQAVVSVAAITLFLILHLFFAFFLEGKNFFVGQTLIWNIAVSSLCNGALCLIFFQMLSYLLSLIGHQPPRDLRYHD